jgi:Domain of unknown function (DUF5658)
MRTGGQEAMSISALHPRRLLLFATLSLLDLALTYKVVRSGGGYVYESNPIANEWLTRFGWTGLAFFKILAMFIAVFSVALISLYRPRTGSVLLNFACLAVSGVVVYSFSLSNVIGNSLEEQYPLRVNNRPRGRPVSKAEGPRPDVRGDANSDAAANRECLARGGCGDESTLAHQIDENLKSFQPRQPSLISRDADRRGSAGTSEDQ